MIGLVIVTHGRLAEEFVFAMEHVVGPQRGVAAICIGPDDDMERRRRDNAREQHQPPESSNMHLFTSSPELRQADPVARRSIAGAWRRQGGVSG